MARPAGVRNRDTVRWNVEFRRVATKYPTIDAALAELVDDVSLPINVRGKALLCLAGVLSGRISRDRPST
jgi:hypothetical protein